MTVRPARSARPRLSSSHCAAATLEPALQTGPLPTNLPQCPPFYDFKTSPHQAVFAGKVTVAIFVNDDNGCVPVGRAPYYQLARERPGHPGELEIQTKAAVPSGLSSIKSDALNLADAAEGFCGMSARV